MHRFISNTNSATEVQCIVPFRVQNRANYFQCIVSTTLLDLSYRSSEPFFSCSASITTGRRTRVAPVAAPARRVRFLHAVKVRSRRRLFVRPALPMCLFNVAHFRGFVRCISTALACSLLLYRTCCALMTESGWIFWIVADVPISRVSSPYGMVACSVRTLNLGL